MYLLALPRHGNRTIIDSSDNPSSIESQPNNPNSSDNPTNSDKPAGVNRASSSHSIGMSDEVTAGAGAAPGATHTHTQLHTPYTPQFKPGSSYLSLSPFLRANNPNNPNNVNNSSHNLHRRATSVSVSNIPTLVLSDPDRRPHSYSPIPHSNGGIGKGSLLSGKHHISSHPNLNLINGNCGKNGNEMKTNLSSHSSNFGGSMNIGNEISDDENNYNFNNNFPPQMPPNYRNNSWLNKAGCDYNNLTIFNINALPGVGGGVAAGSENNQTERSSVGSENQVLQLWDCNALANLGLFVFCLFVLFCFILS